MGKAATKAHNKYNAKTYDRINFVVPKGHKDDIKAAADTAGESLNGYIANAVDERMKREKPS
jgi:uncharacterized protein (DUF1778 family)